GGDVSLTLGALAAPGGDVRLEAQDEVLISQSLVDVNRTADAPGTISIRGGKIVVERSSLVRAENESDVPPSDPDVPGPGTISVAASESVIVDASLLSVSTHAAGNAGTIHIASPEITLRNGVGFDPLTSPQDARAGARAGATSSGRGGEIKGQADDLVTIANGVGVSAAAVGSAVTGDAGNVTFAAPQVEVTRDSYVSAETAGGRGGNITIEAGESLLVDASLLSVNTWSTGEAGTIHLGSEDHPIADVTFQHWPEVVDPSQPVVAAVGARAETQTSGAAGTIEIDAHALHLSDGAVVSATAVGSYPDVQQTGDAGTVLIRADSVDLSDRAGIGAAGWGSTGRGGTIQIDLGDEGGLSVDGANITSSSQGTPGTIDVEGGSVELSNGGSINSSCNPGCIANSGETGRIEIGADSIVLETGGGVFANTNGAGRGGDITVNARSVTIGPGGNVDASTSGAGDAGTITVNAQGTVTIRNGRIGADSGTPDLYSDSGKAGSIAITAGAVELYEDRGIGANKFF